MLQGYDYLLHSIVILEGKALGKLNSDNSVGNVVFALCGQVEFQEIGGGCGDTGYVYRDSYGVLGKRARRVDKLARLLVNVVVHIHDKSVKLEYGNELRRGLIGIFLLIKPSDQNLRAVHTVVFNIVFGLKEDAEFPVFQGVFHPRLHVGLVDAGRGSGAVEEYAHPLVMLLVVSVGHNRSVDGVLKVYSRILHAVYSRTESYGIFVVLHNRKTVDNDIDKLYSADYLIVVCVMHQHNKVILKHVAVGLVSKGGLGDNASHFAEELVGVFCPETLPDICQSVGVQINKRIPCKLIGGKE